MLATPMAYTPDCEFQEEDEAQTTAELVETLRNISEKVQEPRHPA